MTASKRHLIVTWLFLITLTTIGYLASAFSRTPGTLSHLIPLLTAAAKFSLVAWIFMELRSVSRYWAFGLGTLLALILIVFISLRSISL